MQPLRLPRLLRPGDRVAVIAPAGPLDPRRLERGVEWLRDAGFDVVVGSQARATSGHGMQFLAGPDVDRRHDLVTALLDPEVRAVVAGRGGDGTPRLLDALPWGRLATTEPTIVAGLSDITALHQAVAARLDWATLWSPMPATEVLAGAGTAAGPEPAADGGGRVDEWSRAGLLRALRDESAADLLLEGTTLVEGRPVTAPLVGGTMALLSSMAGTAGFHPASGAIAVIEDIGERAYRIERFLTHLRRAGFFDDVVGVAVGDLVDCRPPDQVAVVVTERLGDLGVPVVTDLPFGHGRRQASLWLGRNATLDPAAGTLSQAHPA